jgi:hypothetical protein
VDSQSWKGRSLSWLKTQAPKHELYISAEVVAELSAPTFSHKEAALAFTAGIPLLAFNDEIPLLGQLLIEQQVMPGPLKGDAIHAAIAAYYGMEYILTWNVKHLANPNKRIHLTRILMNAGKAIPSIVTPEVLWEDDDHG